MSEDVSDGERSAEKQDIRKMVFGQHGRRDGTSRIESGEGGAGKRLASAMGLGSRFLEINVRFDGVERRIRFRSGWRAPLVRRESGR
jgi:hypothetical protein